MNRVHRFLVIMSEKNVLELVILIYLDEEQRILTRCDTFPTENQTFPGKKKQTTPFLHKSLSSIFPNLDQFAVILDDREDIWSTSVEVRILFILTLKYMNSELVQS